MICIVCNTDQIAQSSCTKHCWLMTFNGINKNQDVTRLPSPLASEKETWFWLWSVLVDLLYLFGREVSHKNLCSAPPCHEVACSPSSVVQTPAPGLVPGGSQVFVEREHQYYVWGNGRQYASGHGWWKLLEDDQGWWKRMKWSDPYNSQAFRALQGPTFYIPLRLASMVGLGSISGSVDCRWSFRAPHEWKVLSTQISSLIVNSLILYDTWVKMYRTYPNTRLGRGDAFSKQLALSQYGLCVGTCWGIGWLDDWLMISDRSVFRSASTVFGIEIWLLA